MIQLQFLLYCGTEWVIFRRENAISFVITLMSNDEAIHLQSKCSRRHLLLPFQFGINKKTVGKRNPEHLREIYRN
jgi:hypothetical protein